MWAQWLLTSSTMPEAKGAHGEVLGQPRLKLGPPFERELAVQQLGQLLASVHAPRVQHLPQAAPQGVHICCRAHSALHAASWSPSGPPLWTAVVPSKQTARVQLPGLAWRWRARLATHQRSLGFRV